MLIRPIDALLPRLGRQFGGKAAGLAALVRAGFPVPAAYALSRDAADEVYSRVLPSGRLSLLGDGRGSEALTTELQARVLEHALAPRLQRELARTLSQLREAAVESVAVRSSSTLEDQASSSAAGLFATTLHVRDEGRLFDAVRQAWASLLSPAALSYAATVGALEHAGMGVVIQAMVPADAAGVLFTENPLTGDTDEIVIHSVLGLGTQVTGGTCTPDTFRIDKRTGFVRDRVIAHKQWRVTLAKEGGLTELRLAAFEADLQSLDEHALAQLTVLGRRIEEHFGEPRDVEFAVAGDTVFVLQSRGVSARPSAGTRTAFARKGLGARLGLSSRKQPPARKASGADPSSMVWSRAGISDVLPGVATPLTFSVLGSFADVGFREALAALGCKVPKGARLLGSFRGRSYLSVSELERITAQVPGLTPAHLGPLAAAALGSVRRSSPARAPQERSGSLLLRLPGLTARIAAAHLGLEQRVQRFGSSFEAERARIERLDLRILPGAALDETLSDIERLLDQTGALIGQAYGGLFGALWPLRSAIAMLAGKDAAAMESRLLSSIEDAESAGPGREVLAVARAFDRDAAARTRLLTGELRSLAELPQGPALAAMERLLDHYGHRAAREAELAEPRWREDPRFLFDAVRMQLSHEQYGDDAQGSLDRGVDRGIDRGVDALRTEAEGALAKLPSASRAALRMLVSVVRKYVRRREQLRSQLAHVLCMLRRVALDTSRRMLVREPELAVEPAFMLTVAEVHAFLRGELRSVVALTALRERQYARDLRLPDPPPSFVGYPPPSASVTHDSVDRFG